MSTLRDKPLSKEEQEEEEMRNELKDAGVLEDNLDRNEIKQLYEIIKESKNASLYQIELSEDESKSNKTFSELHDQERPIPSFSYRQSNRNSVASTSSNYIKEKSPEGFYGKRNNNQSLVDESIFDSKYDGKTDQFPPLSSPLSSNTNNKNKSNMKLRDTSNRRMTPAMMKKRQQERWKLNLGQFVQEESDDLVRPEISDDEDDEDDPFLQYCYQDLTPEIFEKLTKLMSDKLDILHEKFTQVYPDDGEGGAPIKVVDSNKLTKKESTFKQNMSANKKLPNYDCEPGTSNRGNLDRASKRKAMHTIAQRVIDDDNDNEFVDTKKRKFQTERNKKEENKDQENQRSKSNINIQAEENLSDLDMFDNSDLHSIRKSTIDKKTTEQQEEYPRRVPPPNPTKKNNKGPRAQKKNATQSQLNCNKKNHSLNPEEILQSLDDTENDVKVPNKDTEFIDITGDSEIKVTGIHKKMQAAQSLLQFSHEAQAKKANAEEMAKKQKERDESMQKNELIVKRLHSREEERQIRIDKERKMNESQQIYNNILGNKSKVTKNNYKIPKLNSGSVVEEHTIEVDGNEDTKHVTRSNSVERRNKCPICQKSFPSSEIENHASECTEFCSVADDISQPSTSRSLMNSDLLICDICDNYQTWDAYDFEEHVTACKTENGIRSNGVY